MIPLKYRENKLCVQNLTSICRIIITTWLFTIRGHGSCHMLGAVICVTSMVNVKEIYYAIRQSKPEQKSHWHHMACCNKGSNQQKKVQYCWLQAELVTMLNLGIATS